MNALFTYASATNVGGQHAKFLEFKRLDKEIKTYQRDKTYKELFHSLQYALMCCRAKQIIRKLCQD